MLKHRFQYMPLLLALFAACGFICGPAYGLSSDEEDIRTAVEKRIERARSFEIPSGICYTIRNFQYLQDSDKAKIEELRRLSKTDLNSRYQLDILQSKIESGGSEQRVVLYYQSPDHWRTNRESSDYSLSPYTDSAHGQDGYWAVSKRQLQAVERLSDLPDGRVFDPKFDLNFARFWLAGLMTGIPWRVADESIVARVEAEDHHARVRVESDDRVYVMTIIKPDGESWNSFQTQDVEIYDDGGANRVGICHVGAWVRVGAFENAVSGKQEIVLADGSMFSDLELVSAEPLERDIAYLTALPKGDGEDAIRGPYTFTSIVDYSRAKRDMIDPVSKQLVDSASLKKSDGWMHRYLIVFPVVLIAMLLTYVFKKWNANSQGSLKNE